MNLTTTLKQPAPPDSRRYASRYLNEIIDYGGHPCSRAEAILDMQATGATQPMIDRWLQGYELMQRIRRRNTQLQVTMTLPPHQRRRRVAERLR